MGRRKEGCSGVGAQPLARFSDQILRRVVLPAGRRVDRSPAGEYGSQGFQREITAFWLNGDLTISPREQVAFLQRMFSYDLPVDRRHIDAVKAAMTMPRKVSTASG